MDTANEILRALGRIEGELVEIRKLSERVSKLELWQSWLKGGWAALAAARLPLQGNPSFMREAREEHFSRTIGHKNRSPVIMELYIPQKMSCLVQSLNSKIKK